MSLFEAVIFWMVGPLFCELLGFALVCWRPRAVLAWSFLVLMLSLSQLRFWPDWYEGFQQTASAMVWADWFRVPAVGYRAFIQHAWPAALLVAASHFCRAHRRVARATLSLAVICVIYAGLQAGLYIAWSEDFRTLSFLFEFQEQYRNEWMAAAMAGVVCLAGWLNRRLGWTLVGCIVDHRPVSLFRR
jgi:hypothetical protein